jgi:hypothetical protein
LSAPIAQWCAFLFPPNIDIVDNIVREWKAKAPGTRPALGLGRIQFQHEVSMKSITDNKLEVNTLTSGEWLAILHKDEQQTGGHAHFWRPDERAGESAWFGVNDSDARRAAFKALHGGDMYVSVNPSFQIPPCNKSGNTNPKYIAKQVDYIGAVNVLMGEWDGKDYVEADEYAPYLVVLPESATKQERRTAIKTAKEAAFYADPDKYKARALAAIRALPYAPTIIIDSGGGYHCYWQLSGTVYLDDNNRADVADTQHGWVKMNGADPASSDISRFLRVVGTKNCKPGWNGNNPTVTIIEYNPELIYDYADLESAVMDWQMEQRKAGNDVHDVDITPGDSPKHGDVRSKFNARASIVKLLKGKKYKVVHENKDKAGNVVLTRMSRPDKGAASVTVFPATDKLPEIAVMWSGNDELHSELVTDNDGKFKRKGHDAYSVYASLYCEGLDGKAVWVEVKKMLGLWEEAPKAKAKKRDVNPTTGEIIGADVPTMEDVENFLNDAPIDDVFAKLAAIDEGDDQERRREVEQLADKIGSVDRTLHGRLLTAILTAAPSYTKSEAKEFIKACVAKAKKLAKDREAAAAAERKVEMMQAAIDARSPHTIIVGDRQLKDVTVEAVYALVDLVQANPQYPPLYVKVGQLSRVVCDENGIYSSQEIKPTAMPGILSKAADWVMQVENATSYKEVNVFPPKDVVADVLSLGIWPNIPPLGNIVKVPVFGKDGTLHCEPGYNQSTQLYYTGGVVLGDTSSDRVEWAKHMLLTEMMGNFPFKDEASKAHALVYALNPFVREMISGPVPPTVFDAPTEGTGKGKLLDACGYIALGHSVPTMADTDDDDEWRKTITSKLKEGATHIVIDNINREINSGVLANAWTQPYWDARLLGGNTTVQIPNRMIWALSANNILLSRENARRVVWCRLDANMEKPWTRDVNLFRHPELLEWVSATRNDLVTSVVILAKSWLDAGQPRYVGRSKGSFESWSKVVGGILQHVGLPGFLGNEDELFENVVTDVDEMGEFIQGWWDKYGDTVAGVNRHLFKLASVSDNDDDNRLGDYLNLLGAKLTSPKQRGRQTQLGNLMHASTGRVYRGFKVVAAGVGRGAEKLYKLEDHRNAVAQSDIVEVTI